VCVCVRLCASVCVSVLRGALVQQQWCIKRLTRVSSSSYDIHVSSSSYDTAIVYQEIARRLVEGAPAA
jgi:hypothetical protein